MNIENKAEPAPSRKASPDLAGILAAPGGRKTRRRPWLLYLLLAAGLGAGAWLYLQPGGTTRYDYTTQPVTRGNLSVIVTATGSVQPTEQVDISSELSGTVRQVNVGYNSTVKKGDILAELDTNKQEADVQSARAQLASASANVLKSEAEVASARITLDRLTGLVRNRISSQQDLDAAKYSHDAALAGKAINEASVLSAEANLRLAEVNLEKLKIVSPIDGIVLTRDIEPGQTVAASLNAPVLFTMAGDLRQMELQVSVDEADVGQVRDGQSASFSVDAYPERRFPAKIEAVRFASETVSNVVTYKAILTVDNAELLLRPGMTATADITVEAIENALLVPNAALRYAPPEAVDSSGSALDRLFGPPRPPGGRNRAGQQQQANQGARGVWVLRQGVPERVTVETGASDGRFTVVTSGGIAEGDQLVTAAAARGN